MTAPRGPQPVPPVVDDLAGGRPVTAVWVNELGGVTFAIGAGAPAEFVKVYPDDVAHLLALEVTRLRWARPYTPVPIVLGSGPGWMHTAAVAGRSAVDPIWSDRPATAATAIGSGLRMLHDALPVAGCPFGRPSWVRGPAPVADRLVVCHGDACAPNTLMADDGSCSGHVDLGDLGVADRWADLAIATMSLDWNYPSAADGGPDDWAATLLDAYGVAPDRERIAHYRALWNNDTSAPG
ncbi:aminoglycoside phosphotransferase [Mycolicibacterium aurum]|uniref:Aminoglycoside phosphotransferase n=1 Tax=Mycolicibacterium aurum TaxID=1791 RepID=A0A448J1F6_MYCAU|nr:aminoglycoside 3'-phosphotransferase [Mycolicibacterium aurum]VEG58387.1 aminoglycoside phosphotransferase [Mycolicibacterium aurum]